MTDQSENRRPYPRAVESAPLARTDAEKIADLTQLARWLEVISFLDLLELSTAIIKSDEDPNLPPEVKLAKALATWARTHSKETA